MPPPVRTLALLAASFLLASPAPSQGEAAPARESVLDEVLGTVRAVDAAAHRVRVETASGMVEFSLDRNTLVYLPRGLGTVLDIEPGAFVRAGLDAASVAYWVQVRPAPRSQGRPRQRAPGAPSLAAGPPARGAPDRRRQSSYRRRIRKRMASWAQCSQ